MHLFDQDVAVVSDLGGDPAERILLLHVLEENGVDKETFEQPAQTSILEKGVDKKERKKRNHI